jgi:hypothetical protein
MGEIEHQTADVEFSWYFSDIYRCWKRNQHPQLLIPDVGLDLRMG